VREDESPDMVEWEPIARRGAFSLIVLTPARSRRDVSMMHEDAEFCGIVIPDDRDAFPLGFLSVERLQSYLAETQPHTIAFRGIDERDASEFAALVECPPAGAALH
jgi:hypothetical protein